MKKLILIDADGVVLNWDDAFEWWVKRKYGVVKVPRPSYTGGVFGRYDVTKEEWDKLTREFNATDEAGELPPLRDAIHYIRKLHEKYGYVFRCITSFSLHPRAQRLRTENLRRYFGSAIQAVAFADTCADKAHLLQPFAGAGIPWIEDKVSNCVLGADMGLKPYLMMHQYNYTSACDAVEMDSRIIPVANWEDLCYKLTRV